MFSGLLFRAINLDFLSSHHIFNKLAYRQMFRHAQPRSFPTLEKIQHYSGILGPDGLWWSGRMPSSHHVYNPVRNEGSALTQVSQYYDSLVRASRFRREDEAALSAAYLSHFIVDALDPAHHKGQKRLTGSLDDWEDPHLPYLRFAPLRNFFHRHFIFEFFSASYLFLRQQWYLRRMFRFRRKKTKPQLLDLLRQRIHIVHRLKIYDRFFQKTMEQHAKRQILFVLFPLMISSVAQFWWSAWKETLRFRRSHH